MQYILRNNYDKLYIGHSSNVQNRISDQANKKGAEFVKTYQGFRLVHTEYFMTQLEAMRREKQLKRWTRAKKEALIAGDLELLKKL